MTMHISVAGPILDKGWSMDQAITAIKACADLILELEEEVEEEGANKQAAYLWRKCLSAPPHSPSKVSLQ